MTEKEYHYGQTNSIIIIIIVSMQVLHFSKKIYSAAFEFEFCNPTEQNKIHCTNHEKQAANENN